MLVADKIEKEISVCRPDRVKTKTRPVLFGSEMAGLAADKVPNELASEEVDSCIERRKK